MKKFFWLVLIVTVFDCGKNKNPINSRSSEVPEVDDSRIVFGQGIDGIKIGDDDNTVVAKLGQPTRIFKGDFTGIVYCYEHDTSAFTYVGISDDPALGLGVIGVTVEVRYRGKSKDGIGIGSERDFVIGKIGKPDATFAKNLLQDSYFYDRNTFAVIYENHRVLAISMATANCSAYENSFCRPFDVDDDSRIIPGQSIESVRIGEDASTVIRKLGQPTQTFPGDFDGYIYAYEEGDFDLTLVTISNDRALGLGVIGVLVMDPYNGTTKDDIGVGLERDFVPSKIGPPDRVDGTSDIYYYQRNDFYIDYRNQKIFAMAMISRPVRKSMFKNYYQKIFSIAVIRAHGHEIKN